MKDPPFLTRLVSFVSGMLLCSVVQVSEVHSQTFPIAISVFFKKNFFAANVMSFDCRYFKVMTIGESLTNHVFERKPGIRVVSVHRSGSFVAVHFRVEIRKLALPDIG